MPTSNRRRAIILEQFLLSCLITSILIPIEVSLLFILTKSLGFNEFIQDEIALAQLRRVMNVCYDKEISESSLSCRYDKNQIQLVTSERYLYITPGTWIFLVDTDDVSFDVNQGLLYLTYTRNNKSRRALLSYA